MKLSQKVQRCEYSPMRKFYPYAVAAEQQGKQIYKLNIGQPDIKTPEAYFEAARNFGQDVLAYAPSPGIPQLIDAVIQYYARLGVTYQPEHVLITTGGSEALLFLMLSILDEGSEVIIPEPYYPNYSTCVRAAGGKIRPISTCPEENYRYASREKIEPLINENTRALLVTSPGNPTGNVLTPEEMQAVAEIAKEHDIYLICDEVYREFIYDGSPVQSIARLPGIEENLVLVDSVSKRFSACGARIGAVLTKNHDLYEQLLKFAQCRLAVATLDQVAATALYGIDSDYFSAVREEYKHRRDVCYNALRKIPGVVCAEPMGAFYMMAKLPVDDTDAFQQWLLTDFSDNGETVMFAPGSGFYETPGGGKNEIRIAYILEAHKLERAMELLAKAIPAYQNREKQ